MTLHCCRAIALAVAIVSITGCSSSKKSDTPSSLREIYSEQAIGALKNASEMRVDRITRTSEGASSDFELKEYRVVQPGRSLTAEEMEKLREVLPSVRPILAGSLMILADVEVLAAASPALVT